MLRRISITLLFFAFFACSTMNEDELLESAQKNIDNENYQEALKDFQQLVSEFPEGKYKGLAHFEMGKLYQGNVITGLSKEESMLKAVEHYKIVYSEYPEMTEAPGALFMVGFIQANELNRFEEARKAYDLFLQKYPEHELAVSAKTELETLGLTPEEILQKSISSPQ